MCWSQCNFSSHISYEINQLNCAFMCYFASVIGQSSHSNEHVFLKRTAGTSLLLVISRIGSSSTCAQNHVGRFAGYLSD